MTPLAASASLLLLVVVTNGNYKGMTLTTSTKTRRPRRGLGSKPRRDVYAEVTGKIVAQLEGGVGSWHQSWQSIARTPRNIASRRPYRGVNVLALAFEGADKGYTSSYWGTFNQWRETEVDPTNSDRERVTRTVRKGEKATTAILWKPFEKRVETGGDEFITTYETKRGLLVRGFAVFNADQVDTITYDADGNATHAPLVLDLDDTKPRHSDERDADFDELVLDLIEHRGLRIDHGSDRAYYTPGLDRVSLPTFESFDSANAYYGTAAHELTHWTGHESRLNRQLTNRFGDDQYAAEELIAELGSAFVLGKLGLVSEPRKDHAEYLASWLRVLKADSKAIFTAAAAAQKAADFITDSAPVESEVEPEAEVAA